MNTHKRIIENIFVLNPYVADFQIYNTTINRSRQIAPCRHKINTTSQNQKYTHSHTHIDIDYWPFARHMMIDQHQPRLS